MRSQTEMTSSALVAARATIATTPSSPALVAARASQRGYALVAVVLIIVALTITGTAALRMASSGLQSAHSHVHTISMAACARATRDALASHLRFGSQIPSEFNLQITGEGGEAVLLVQEGHDPVGVTAALEAVTYLDDVMLGAGRTPGLHDNLTSELFTAGGVTGSGAARVVAVCHDPATGRAQEYEFLIRFGI